MRMPQAAATIFNVKRLDAAQFVVITLTLDTAPSTPQLLFVSDVELFYCINAISR